MSLFDDPEYQHNLYLKLLDNWDYRFMESWRSVRRYWSEDKLGQTQETELPSSSAIAKRIYIAQNEEQHSAPYMEMFGYLTKRTPKELEVAESLLYEFKNFLETEKLSDEEKLKLKTIYPHIAGTYAVLYGDEKTKPTFTEFLKPLNDILQKLEQKNSPYPSTKIFDQYMSDYYNIMLDKTLLAMKLKLLTSASKETTDCQTLHNIQNDFSTYSRIFPETVNQKFLSNYIQYIIPRALKKKDIFGIQSNKWGCATGKGISRGVGAATYAYKCYATEITPRGINDLLQMSNEVLGGDLSKHEQIRKDALLLNRWFPRDPIHDSSPGVNEIISKMVAYYDAPAELKESALSELKKVNKIWKDTIYDLAKYDETNLQTNEKHIDILRRINDNMSANNKDIPITENEALNVLAQNAGKDEQPIFQNILPLAKALNQEMLSAIDAKQTGFSPEMVHLIAWTDRRLSLALNNMDFEKQMGFYQSDDCKEVLMFSELTHSASETFDKQEFNDFYEHKVKESFDMEEAYQNIANRQNNLLFGLYKQYDKDCHAMDDTDNAKIMIEARKERAGSGNTLKALQNLTLYREASTKIGMKQKQEREQRIPYRQLMIKEFHKNR